MTRPPLLLLGALVALPACSGDHAPAGMVVVVQKWDAAANCYATMNPDASLNPALGITSCSAPADPVLEGDADRVRVIIDYGDIKFSSTADVPAPKLTISGDGKRLPISVDVERGSRGPRAFFLATFTAPAGPISELAIAVDAAAGFGKVVDKTFRVDPPAVDLAVEQCAVTPCELVAGVGSAVVKASVRGSLPQQVNLYSTIDGVEQPGTATIDVATPGDNAVTGTTFIAVPVAADGSQWTLTGQLGPVTKVLPAITLHLPRVQLTLSCGASCTLQQGAKVGVGISVPTELHTHQAIVTARLDGVQTLSPLTVDLDVIDSAKDLRSGETTLPIPNQAGILTVDADVGGFKAPTASITVE